MHNKKYGFQRAILSVSFISCLCMLFLASSGCAPLRKKFTRAKKKDQKTDPRFIPVLDPLDYPEAVYSAEESYRHHYSLWKVWDKDFLQVLERDGSKKRQKYLLAQSIEQLDEMHNILNDDKKVELMVLIDVLRAVHQSYDKSSPMRSKFSTRSKVQRNAKMIRNGFSPKLIFLPEG